MKKLVYTLFLLGLGALALPAQTPGSLDPTFGNQGLKIIDHNTFETITDFVIQPDGKVVAVGFSEEDNNYQLAVMRFLPDGSLDPSFASAGVLYYSVGSPYNEAHAVALQPDGKILLAGFVIDTASTQLSYSNEDFLVVRLNADGTIDNTFGDNGAVILNQQYNERASAIALTSEGKILVAGSSFHQKIASFLIYQLNSDGSTDVNFGNSGYQSLTITSGVWNYCADMALQADGKIVLAGESKSPSGFINCALMRLNPNGTLDNTFSSDGKATNSLGLKDDGAQTVLIQPDGKIVVGGYATDNSNVISLAIARYTADGGLDNTFGSSGKTVTPVGDGFGTVADLCLTAQGNFVAVGTAKRKNSYFDFMLANFNAGGNLNTNFGNQGFVFTDFDGHYDGLTTAHLLPDGRLLVAGAAVSTTNSITEFMLARYWFGEGTDTKNIHNILATTWAYPNPLGGGRHLSLRFTLLESARTRVELFNMNGELLQQLGDAERSAGEYEDALPISTDLPAGMYLLRLSAGAQESFLKIIIQ